MFCVICWTLLLQILSIIEPLLQVLLFTFVFFQLLSTPGSIITNITASDLPSCWFNLEYIFRISGYPQTHQSRQADVSLIINLVPQELFSENFPLSTYALTRILLQNRPNGNFFMCLILRPRASYCKLYQDEPFWISKTAWIKPKCVTPFNYSNWNSFSPNSQPST